MSQFNSRIAQLKAMLSLEEKRSALQEQLDALTQQLNSLKDQLFDDAPSALLSRSFSTKTPSPSPAKSGKKGRSKRGALKEQILAALSSAGTAGVRVTELAGVLGTKAANIHAWFHSTGKRIPGLSKVAGGHYRLKGGAFDSREAAPAAKATTPASKTSAPAKSTSKASTIKAKGKAKEKGSKRGELSDNIIKALEAAGDKGLKIKDLADEVGAKYRNVSVWFVTTGKNYPKIKKVAPAHYKIAA